MKVGIFGNTNNYPYVLALGLRRIGVEAALVVNRRELLHRPEAKDPSLADNYPDWIMDCSNVTEQDFVLERSSTEPVLGHLYSGSDGLILNSIGPSLLPAARLPGVSFLTGSDLTYYANHASEGIRTIGWAPEFGASATGQKELHAWREFVLRQRRGIFESRAVSFGVPGFVPEGDALLREIGVPEERRFFVYIADTVELSPAPPASRRELRIFLGARLNWVEPLPHGFSSQDNKRTDILLRGFAEFLHAGGKGVLVLVEKGLHIAETRALARELEIDHALEWRPEMDLAAFYDQVRAADVVCDQLGPSFPGMVGLDAMAIGRPVMANFRMELIAHFYPEPWPVLHVQSATDVRDALLHLQESPDRAATLGRAARRFAETYLSPEVNARMCLERLGLAGKTARRSASRAD